MFTHRQIGILAKDNLISGEISRKILDAIKKGGNIPEEAVQYNISIDEFKDLKNAYLEKLRIFPTIDSQPRYVHFYYLLNDKFPEISWQIKTKTKFKPIVNFSLPLINNLQPSLASLLFNRVKIISEYNFFAHYPELEKSLEAPDIEALVHFMQVSEVIYPNKDQMKSLLNWIKHAKKGESSTIFILTCPDYSVEATNDPLRPYKHTFEFLGEDIGQIAKRIISILPNLKKLLVSLDIQPKIISAIADYEAFSYSNLSRTNLTKEAFLKKVAISKRKFEKECQNDLAIQTFMCSELCNGEKEWLKKVTEISQNFIKEEKFDGKINTNLFSKIAYKRKSLYKNWFGNSGSIQDYIPIAINQAAEYTAIGYYITSKFDNCLILGADSELFGPFYNLYKQVSSLYFKRFYS